MDFPDKDGAGFEGSWPPWYKTSAPYTMHPDTDQILEIVEAAFELIGQAHSGYQERKPQIRMACRILDCLLKDKTLVMEAGTGIGKSFAYLIAAISVSYLRGERCLISTETKNLQMQLMEKDLPALQTILAPDLTYELGLGSGNYLCRLRHEETFLMGNFRDILTKEREKEYRDWAREVFEGMHQGHVFELKTPFPGAFWSQVGRDPDGCPSNRCAHFSSCNYYRVKGEWEKSRLLVINHHLALYNLINDKRTLPAYGFIILDEAHGFLSTAHSIYTLTYTPETVSDLKKKFDRALKPALPPEALEEWEDLWKRLDHSWNLFFSNWEVQLDLSFDEDKTQIVDGEEPMDTVELEAILENMTSDLQEIAGESEDSGVVNQLNSTHKTLAKMLRFVGSFRNIDIDKFVYWGEKRQGKFFLNACNLRIGEELAPVLTEPQVWTSATMGYWPFPHRAKSKRDLLDNGYLKPFLEEALSHLDAADIETDFIASPFDYANHSALYIPTHLKQPAWGAPPDQQQEFEEKLAAEIVDLIELSGGGALVLFTSHYMLRRIGDILEEEIRFPVHSQSELGAGEALKRFRADPDSVLLGTNSYWQGVDVVGRGLRMLIITKLMFTPPDDPILVARSRALERNNEKPFFKLSLPRSGMMLRQAFGRLIRNENDKGIAAILDTRLVEKSYGKILTANLPQTPILYTPDQLEKHVFQTEILNG